MHGPAAAYVTVRPEEAVAARLKSPSSTPNVLPSSGGKSIVCSSDGSRLYAASASTRPQPKWLFGTLRIPPQPAALFATVTAGFADRVSRYFVRGMSRTSFGLADQSRATTPTTCGPAIDVPLMLPYDTSPVVRSEERTLAPGAEMSGFMRCEPSTLTEPRLLKLCSAFVVPLIAPVENADA